MLVVDERAVLLLAVVDRAVDLGGIPEKADQPDQPGERARLDDGKVKAPVRLSHGDHVGVLGRLLHVALGLLEAVQALGGHVWYGDGDSLGLEDLADPIDLQEIGEGQLSDEVAAMGHVAHLALTFEDLQRLAQRDPADAELDREGVLDDLLTGAQPSRGDEPSHLVEHRLLRSRRSLERLAHPASLPARSAIPAWSLSVFSFSGRSSQARISSSSAPSAGGRQR